MPNYRTDIVYCMRLNGNLPDHRPVLFFNSFEYGDFVALHVDLEIVDADDPLLANERGECPDLSDLRYGLLKVV